MLFLRILWETGVRVRHSYVDSLSSSAWSAYFTKLQNHTLPYPFHHFQG